jgi:hypothetical protein
LSEILDEKLFNDLFDNLEIEDQIRLKYCTEPHVGSWLSAPPIPSFGLSLDHFNFQTICKWWLGLNQPLAAEKCSLCYVNTTPKATHNLACKNGGDLIKRHNKLRNFIFNLSQQCGLNPILEKKNILGDCDSGKRPADVLIPSWSLNKDYAIDVAVTDPIKGSFKLDLEACEKYAEKYKHDKYDDGFKNTQIIFLPVVFSTFGSLNEEGKLFMKDLFRRNCDSLGQQRCTHMPLLYQKLSIILQKENFKMMSRRFKLSHELSNIRNSTMDGIPEIYQIEIDQDRSKTSESNQKQDLELFLKERLEESNIIFENLSTTSKKEDPLTLTPEEESLLKEDITLSEWINEEKEREEYITKLNVIMESSEDEITKDNNTEDSDSDYDSSPKKGDKVNVKYDDGWHIGRVHSISKKKKYFWVGFKDFDELYKVRRSEKFKII